MKIVRSIQPAEEDTLIVYKRKKEREKKRNRRDLSLFLCQFATKVNPPRSIGDLLVRAGHGGITASGEGGRRVIEQSYVQLLLGARFHPSLSPSLSLYASSLKKGLSPKFEIRRGGRRDIFDRNEKARLARNKDGSDDEEGGNRRLEIRNNRGRSLIIVPNIVAVFPSRCVCVDETTRSLYSRQRLTYLPSFLPIGEKKTSLLNEIIVTRGRRRRVFPMINSPFQHRYNRRTIVPPRTFDTGSLSRFYDRV